MLEVDPLREKDWDSLVLAHPSCSVLHSSGWIRAVSESYGYRAFAFVESSGGVTMALPLMDVRSFLTGSRGVSLPFSDSLPLLCQPADDTLGAIRDRVVSEAKHRGWRYVEFRGGPQLPGFEATVRYVEHVLRLDQGPGELLSRLRSSTRRNVERARREGVTTRFSTSRSALEAYYRLHCVTRRRHGLPPQPLTFFRNLHASVIERGYGQVFLADFEGAPVSGAVFLHFGSTALYKYGASLIDNRGLHAAHLVMWEAISWYFERGYSSLSLGRTEPDNTGLLQFKDGWGSERREIGYSRWPPPASDADARARCPRCLTIAARKLPLGVLRAIGRVAYRHLA